MRYAVLVSFFLFSTLLAQVPSTRSVVHDIAHAAPRYKERIALLREALCCHGASDREVIDRCLAAQGKQVTMQARFDLLCELISPKSAHVEEQGKKREGSQWRRALLIALCFLIPLFAWRFSISFFSPVSKSTHPQHDEVKTGKKVTASVGLRLPPPPKDLEAPLANPFQQSPDHHHDICNTSLGSLLWRHRQGIGLAAKVVKGGAQVYKQFSIADIVTSLLPEEEGDASQQAPTPCEEINRMSPLKSWPANRSSCQP